MRVRPAHRLLQAARRVQHDRAALTRTARAGRHHLLLRQPRAGRRVRRPRAEREGRHRHAGQRPAGEDRRHPRPRCRGRLCGPASSARKLKAEELAAAHGYTIIPPYDHPHIIAGQATCGLEIAQQQPTVDLVLSPVSGGGLLSGTATAIKLAAAAGLSNPAVQVWGAEPALAADAKESFETRHLVEWPATSTTRTLCDGLRTQSLGALNFEHILRYVDGIVAVTEDEILAAMRVYLTQTDLVPEPSGAATLAAALFHQHELPPAQTIVVILSGGNIEPALLESLRKDEALVPAGA